ncbi:Amidophosphoribosyltransferase, chloroplastic [Triticum urartu]|uniref:Amidophosphoribosyltransferase, chloroplastic n=1 Tax=Triticum urartu TaxID=4572 RepID=M8A3E2_TRIUA|nr:Amidophosphoribosyltransferase, chloroplastic [Triticum urartu]
MAKARNDVRNNAGAALLPDRVTPFSYGADDESDDHPREECGLVGVVGHPDASSLCYLGLQKLQHRGEEGAGIVAAGGDGKLKSVTGLGLVADVFGDPSRLASLPGPAAIGHHIYFSLPNSVVFSHDVHERRTAFGRALAEESPAPGADVVIPVPDSGFYAALGFSRQSGLEFQQGLIRWHYSGRSFIQPTQASGALAVKLKWAPVRGVIRGKSVVVVDDSLVRGTPSSKIVRLLRDAGAREVHMRIASPPVVGSCLYGIDTPSDGELISNRMDLEGVRREIGSDSLAFLSLDKLHGIYGEEAGDYCDACFSRKYPVLPTLPEPAAEFEEE